MYKLLPIFISLSLSITFASEYTIKYSIDALDGLKFKNGDSEVVNPIVGDATLSDYTINRGESSNIIWNYQYVDQVNISNLGLYSSSGSESISPLRTTTYTVNASNATDSISKTLTLNVIQPIPAITFNSDKTKVGLGQPVHINWSVSDAESVNISNIGNSLSFSGNETVFPTTDITYTLTASGYESSGNITRSISIDVISNPTISSFTGPNTVFINEPFLLNWSGSNIEKYEISSNNANSGVSTTSTDISTGTSRSVTPINFGSFTYTLDGYNEVEIKNSLNKTVSVEALPTFTGFTVNGDTAITVAPNTALTFMGSGFSSGATLVGRNSSGNANANLPTVSSGTTGSTTYYASATKTLNSISKHSALRSVVVTVEEVEVWNEISPLISNWVNVGDTYDCTNWLPNPATVLESQSFTQNSNHCKQRQERSVQRQEQSSISGVIRSLGESEIEKSNLTNASASRNYTVSLSSWIEMEDTCGEWTPRLLDLGIGASNLSSQSQNCAQNKRRDRTEYYIDNETNQRVDLALTQEVVETPVVNTRTIQQTYGCLQTHTGEDWRVFVSYQDGSDEFAIISDYDISERSRFYLGEEFHPNDSESYIVYKGNNLNVVKNYDGKPANLYQVCYRYTNW